MISNEISKLDNSKPTKSQLPHLKSHRNDGIRRKIPQDIVLFGTYQPQDISVCKELE